MCTKIPHANRLLAVQAVKKLRALGRRERAIHHASLTLMAVTSKKPKAW